jgi:hypothetical protein
MPFDLDQFDDHVQHVIDDLPITFTLSDGFQGEGVITSPDFTQALALGGFEEQIDYKLYVRVRDFPLNKAREGTVLTIPRPGGTTGDSQLSVDMKIKSVNVSADGLVYAFTLGFAKRRAP